MVTPPHPGLAYLFLAKILALFCDDSLAFVGAQLAWANSGIG